MTKKAPDGDLPSGAFQGSTVTNLHLAGRYSCQPGIGLRLRKSSEMY
jgi:hypothetical protein